MRLYLTHLCHLYIFRQPQAGCPNFVNLALRFVYGEDSVPLKEKRVAGVQTLSGTGGLRVFGEVLHQFGHKHIYVVSALFASCYTIVPCCQD
jgi:aspartate/tyrosine/aromatic aminotransferase